MTKSELLTSLTNSRQRLVDLINDASDLELIEPDTIAGWSVKDVLAHLAAWEAELVTALAREVSQNRKPKLVDIDDAETEKLNQKWFGENKDRPLDRVREDFAGARKQLLRQINNIPDKDLTDPKKYKWLNGKTLADYILDYANSHDDEHFTSLTAWHDGRQLA